MSIAASSVSEEVRATSATSGQRSVMSRAGPGAPALRHPPVEDRDLGLGFSGERDGLVGVVGLAHELEGLLPGDHRSDQRAGERIVVGDITRKGEWGGRRLLTCPLGGAGLLPRGRPAPLHARES